MPSEHPPRMSPTPGCSFQARVAFTYGDRQFQPLDPFPYAELGMTEDAAWNFWRSAMIEVAVPAQAAGAVQSVAAPVAKHPHRRRW